MNYYNSDTGDRYGNFAFDGKFKPRVGGSFVVENGGETAFATK